MVPLLYAYILSLVVGLIWFDCHGHGLNITILSLLDIYDCELAEIEEETSTEETYVQHLQLSDYDKTRVQQHKEVDDIIFYCDVHTSPPYKTVAGYICRACWTPPANDCTKLAHYL